MNIQNPLEGFTPEERDTLLERLASIVELDRACATRADHEILMSLLKILLCRRYNKKLSTMAQLEILLESLPCEGDDVDPTDVCCQSQKTGAFDSTSTSTRDPLFSFSGKADYYGFTSSSPELAEYEQDLCCSYDVCKKEQLNPLSDATLPELVEELTRRVSGS